MASRVALPFNGERATRAVPSFLRDTKVGQMVSTPQAAEEENEDGGGEEIAEEGVPASL